MIDEGTAARMDEFMHRWFGLEPTYLGPEFATRCERYVDDVDALIGETVDARKTASIAIALAAQALSETGIQSYQSPAAGISALAARLWARAISQEAAEHAERVCEFRRRQARGLVVFPPRLA